MSVSLNCNKDIVAFGSVVKILSVNFGNASKTVNIILLIYNIGNYTNIYFLIIYFNYFFVNFYIFMI